MTDIELQPVQNIELKTILCKSCKNQRQPDDFMRGNIEYRSCLFCRRAYMKRMEKKHGKKCYTCLLNKPVEEYTKINDKNEEIQYKNCKNCRIQYITNKQEKELSTGIKTCQTCNQELPIELFRSYTDEGLIIFRNCRQCRVNFIKNKD